MDGSFVQQNVPRRVRKRFGDRNTCPGCRKRMPIKIQVPPTVIQWAPGSDYVGDFTWPESYVIVVKADVASELTGRFSELEALQVSMEKTDPAYMATAKYSSKRVVKLPYSGPPLRGVRTVTEVELNFGRSTITIDLCDICERTFGVLDKRERWVTERDSETGELGHVHQPRARGEGVIVDRELLGGSNWFRLGLLGGAGSVTFCTSGAKDFIERKGYTNIAFLEAGEFC